MATIRFYKYFFIGLEKPVIMEAENKMMADDMLYHLSQKSKTNWWRLCLAICYCPADAD